MKTLTFKITGKSPLLMHNGRLANPRDKYTRMMKVITKKRTKTDEDHEELAMIEARGGLYYSEHSGVYMPGENIEATLINSAKLQKLGTALKRAARVVEIECPIEHSGPKDPDKLVRDPDFTLSKMVKVTTSKVLRTRPIFHEWSTSFTVAYNTTQLNDEDIKRIVKDAGEFIGIGDWRPRYGLFESEVVQ